ncbi:hypothetical protein PAI99_08810, partial [Campylobacter jejuni]|nr:hypothetical protein [Campylobacter jejuni]
TRSGPDRRSFPRQERTSRSLQSAHDHPKGRGIRAALTRTAGKHAPLPRRRHRKSPLIKRLQRLALSIGAFAVVGAIGMG